jgi:hypothetical protein
MAHALAEHEAQVVLRRYEIRVAEKPPEPGPDLVVAGYEDEHHGRVIALHGGAHAARRHLPLSEADAESMLDAFSSERSIAHDHKSRAMIAHLLLKAAKMYEETGIDRFGMIARVHDNGYLVRSVTMWSNGEPHVTPRLTPHAHDNPPRAYGFRPDRAERVKRSR